VQVQFNQFSRHVAEDFRGCGQGHFDIRGGRQDGDSTNLVLLEVSRGGGVEACLPHMLVRKVRDIEALSQ